MNKFLVDANLPCYFSLWNNEEYIHVRDINPQMKDSEIWNYAKKYNLTIITKDSDFSKRIIINEPPPRIIHIRFGNLKMKDFHEKLTKIWQDVYEYSKINKLVTVFNNRLEAIN